MQVRPNRIVTLTLLMAHPQTGDTLDDRHAQDPLEIMFGRGHLLPELEGHIKGLRKGQTFDVTFEDAYGTYNTQMVQKVGRARLPEDIREGMALSMQIAGSTNPMIFHVKRITKDHAHLDGNHPMSGQDIRFVGQIVHVRGATPEEMERGEAIEDTSPKGDVCPPMD